MKPPDGLWAVWDTVGRQAHAAPGAAPMVETRDAMGMDTLLASQACTARRNLVHFHPDDLGSPCPWDVDRAPCAIYSAKNVRMRGVVVCGVLSSVFLCSGCSCPPWVPRESVLNAPSWRSCPCGCLVALSGVACALGKSSACRRCRIQP